MNVLKMHLAYLRYVVRHKYFVFRAGRVTGAPLWRLIIHDWSKFSRAEWGPYARRFYGGRSGVTDKANDPEEFHRAWTHHWHNNPHHWEYWLAMDDKGGVRPMRMPHMLVREMVADWLGAGRGITGSWDIHPWYEKNFERMILHPVTRVHVQSLIAAHVPTGKTL